jgi:hypothetical protein
VPPTIPMSNDDSCPLETKGKKNRIKKKYRILKGFNLDINVDYQIFVMFSLPNIIGYPYLF